MPTATKDSKTFEEVLEGKKTKVLNMSFAAVWTPEQTGDYILGEYTGREEVPPMNGNKAFMSHRVKIEAFLGSFTQNKVDHKPKPGEEVSASGEVLNRALADIKVGTRIAIKYLGLADKKKGRNPARLFRVLELE